MDLSTTFVKTDDGFIQIDEESRPGAVDAYVPSYFQFQTVTEIKFSGDKAFMIRITRSLPSGLLTYFLKNQRFQDQVLRECQAYAVRHFQSGEASSSPART